MPLIPQIHNNDEELYLNSLTPIKEKVIIDNKSVIEENFDGSFYGKIQRLRMYDIDLPFPEIKKNYNYFSNKYGFRKLK